MKRIHFSAGRNDSIFLGWWEEHHGEEETAVKQKGDLREPCPCVSERIGGMASDWDRGRHPA